MHLRHKLRGSNNFAGMDNSSGQKHIESSIITACSIKLHTWRLSRCRTCNHIRETAVPNLDSHEVLWLPLALPRQILGQYLKLIYDWLLSNPFPCLKLIHAVVVVVVMMMMMMMVVVVVMMMMMIIIYQFFSVTPDVGSQSLFAIVTGLLPRQMLNSSAS